MGPRPVRVERLRETRKERKTAFENSHPPEEKNA